MAGLYLHIPFCKQACTYCDFHFSTSLVYKATIVNAICREIELRKDYLNTRSLNTIYFGGGTPSQLSSDELKQIFLAITKNFDISENAEITLEGNPDDLSKQYLNDLKLLGINRLSIGVQSFRDKDLHYMNRAHNSVQALQSITDASEAGFEKISLDLIYGIPGLSNNEWIGNFKKAASLPIDHLSCYSLTVEEGTPLSKHIRTGKSPKVEDDHAADQFKIMQELSAEMGFEHYEISNLARNSAYSIHNTSYWNGSHYLGTGPSAHSFNGMSRRINIANNQIYLKGLDNENDCANEIEVITADIHYNELILTGFRTKKGISKSEINLLGENYMTYFRKELKKPGIAELIIEAETSFSLKPEAWLRADGIASAFFIV